MAQEWQKLNKNELINLYKEKVVNSRNNENEIPLLTICPAYATFSMAFPLQENSSDLYFLNKVKNSIYSFHENSLLIKTAIKGIPENQRLRAIDACGMMGIQNMNKDNSRHISTLNECFSILYLIYQKDYNINLDELLLYLNPHDERKNNQTLDSFNSSNTDRKKFNSINEYYQFLCDRLNENGYKYSHNITGELCSWEVNKFFMTTLTTNHPKEFESFKFLKDNGYFNMGICPNCGNEMDVVKYSFTSGFNSNINYPICKNCYNDGSRISINPSSDKKGCYIATVCYGDYNSSEVILFRRYRDEVLDKHYLGKIFISVYYFLSPSIANYLKGKQSLNFAIRKYLLDKIYDKLSKRNV